MKTKAKAAGLRPQEKNEVTPVRKKVQIASRQRWERVERRKEQVLLALLSGEMGRRRGKIHGLTWEPLGFSTLAGLPRQTDDVSGLMKAPRPTDRRRAIGRETGTYPVSLTLTSGGSRRLVRSRASTPDGLSSAVKGWTSH